MKAVVVHEYGGPEVLKYEDRPDPVAGEGEVLVRVAATSINPIDLKRRDGTAKGMFPIEFPGVLGADVSGMVAALGAGVTDFAIGDRVFAFADQTYAELCVVKASVLVKIPEGIDTVDAAALPLVTTTGNDLITLGTQSTAGQTVLITGAVGNVGRSAVYTAKTRGATVIAAVRGAQVAEAANLGADQVIAIDDETALANLPLLDAVADTVGGATGAALLAKVKPGGVFGSVLGPPQNAGQYPNVKIAPVSANADAGVLLAMAQAVVSGELTIPIGQKMPLSEAAGAHTAAEKGSKGKILLVA